MMVFVVTAFCSCGNMTEEIYINEDGSGSLDIYMDVAGSMEKALKYTSSLGSMLDNDSSKLKDVDMDSLWKNMPEKFDTVLDASTLLGKETASNPEMVKLTEKMTLYMKADKEKEYAHYGAKYAFKNSKELNEFYKNYNNQSNQEKSNELFGSLSSVKKDIDFKVKKKRIQRKVKVKGTDEIEGSQKMMMTLFFKKSKMRTIVHAPRKIKKAEGEGLVEVKDSVAIYEYDMLKSLFGEVDTGFKITLK